MSILRKFEDFVIEHVRTRRLVPRVQTFMRDDSWVLERLQVLTEGRAFVASNVHQCPSFHQRGFRLHGLHAKPDRCSRGLARSSILLPAISNDNSLAWKFSPSPSPGFVSWCSHASMIISNSTRPHETFIACQDGAEPIVWR